MEIGQRFWSKQGGVLYYVPSVVVTKVDLDSNMPCSAAGQTFLSSFGGTYGREVRAADGPDDYPRQSVRTFASVYQLVEQNYAKRVGRTTTSMCADRQYASPAGLAWAVFCNKDSTPTSGVNVAVRNRRAADIAPFPKNPIDASCKAYVQLDFDVQAAELLPRDGC